MNNEQLNKRYNDQISDLCDWIEEQQILEKMWHGYVNDPIGLDTEGCFV